MSDDATGQVRRSAAMIEAHVRLLGWDFEPEPAGMTILFRIKDRSDPPVMRFNGHVRWDGMIRLGGMKEISVEKFLSNIDWMVEHIEGAGDGA